MTTKIINFPYKEFPARLSAVESDGQWFPLAALCSWNELRKSTKPFPTEQAAIANAKEYVIYEADRAEWKDGF